MAAIRDRIERATNPGRLEGEVEFDTALRPTSFAEFVGQKKLVDNLRVFIQAAKQRGEPLDHCLFYGPPGLGKTTLATIIAHELGVNLRCTSGPALERPLDLVGLLTRLEERDVLFIDEVHRLNRVVEEYLYPALEEYQIDIIIDKGPNARSVRIKLPPFTLIGATTRAGLLTSPLRSRFGVTNRLDYYKPEELFQIIQRSARILGIGLDEDAGMEIARRSRGTPRVANRLLRRVRDFAQVEGLTRITLAVTVDALRRLDVDELGLDEMDKRIICTVIEKFKGGPVGLNTLAVAVGEDGETIEEVYEPYLVQEGFIDRTSRGRTATERAFAHFGFKLPHSKQETLF